MENKVESSIKSSNAITIIVDKNSLKPSSLTTSKGYEKSQDTIYDSIHREDFVILSNFT